MENDDNINMKYDTIIIGFGKCGKTIAPFLAKRGEKVAFIEESNEMYGGTCINVGCIPSKSLLKSSELSSVITQCIPDPAFVYKRGVEEKERVVAALRKANYDKLVGNPDITFYDGQAHFTADKEIEIEFKDGKKLTIDADKIIVDVGSTSVIPTIDGLLSKVNNPYIYFSNTLMDQKVLPRNLIIIGGGYIGLEFANTYSNFGSKVTVIGNDKHIMPREDQEVAEAVENDFKTRGINLINEARVLKIENNVVRYVDHKEIEHSIKGDAILIATGRRPNYDHLGLNNTSIKLNERGYVAVNEFLETNVSGVYFVGDCNGGPQFTYISLDDSRILKSHFLGENKYSLKDRKPFPYTVFLSPSLSRIGLSEKDALKEGHEIMVGKILVTSIPKAKILGESRGMLKVIVDKKTNLILGAHFYCPLSYELINLIKMAMDNKIPYTYLRDNIYTHPTMSECFNDLFAAVM